jgi:small GTP-binding protein
MNIDLQHPKLGKMRQQLDELQHVAGSVADTDFYYELNELRIKVTEQKFNLVVVGLFKRGKSSLVNAMLGKELAPVAITPLTSVVTSFEYDPEDNYARIYFKGGNITETAPSVAVEYISEEENPANTKNVEAVRIFDNTIPLLERISLVDTPGLGSVYTYNTESTRAYIPKIDAALFVLSADLPISQMDVDFLSELKRTVPKIIFVLNKMETVGDQDLDRLLAHNRKVLLEKELIGPDDLILPVSARLWQSGRKAKSGIEDLLKHIYHQMEEGKEQLIQGVFSKRYVWLSSRLLLALRLKLDALQTPVDELELKQSRLKEVILLLDSQREEFANTIRGETKLLQQYIDRTIQDESLDLRSDIRRQIKSSISQLLNPATLQAYQQELNRDIIDRFEKRWHQLGEYSKEKFNQVLVEYGNRSNSFLNELIRHLSSLMNIDFDIIAGKFDLDVYTSFYLTVEKGAGISGSISPFEKLLPKRDRKNRLSRRLLNYYDAVIIQNAAAVIYDLQYKIQESFRKFSFDLEKRLHDLIHNMNRLISEALITRSQHQEIVGDQISDLRDRIEKLEPKPLHSI